MGYNSASSHSRQRKNLKRLLDECAIKEKSGMTFGELVKKIRMKKAKALLKSSNMTVENISLSVGYQNVEHFNRLFKKAYNMTPMQFRNQK